MLKGPNGSVLLADNIIVPISGFNTPSKKLFWLAYELFMLSPPGRFDPYRFIELKPLISVKLAQPVRSRTYSY